MPEIKAFRGWRYASKKNPASFFAPPYDVISEKERDAFYDKNPYNVIRLILGKDEPGDSAVDNKYTRAGKFWNDWRRAGILEGEDAPALYVYVQNYPSKKGVQERIGFLAAMKLDERAVKRHENTLAAPKKDRLALLKEVKANLSPIFGLFEDRAGAVQKILKAVAKTQPAIDVTIDRVRHRVFVEKTPQRLEAVRRLIRSKPMFIADGHHRFEVACQYKNLMNSHRGAWNYVMTYFSDCLHNPFDIFPTHRLIKTHGKDALKILARLGRLKKMKNLPATLAELPRRRGRYRFGLYTRKNGFQMLELDPRYSKGVKRHPVKKLDVAVLHEKILAPYFGIHSIEKSKAIDFTRDAEEACRRVRNGEFDLAVLVNGASLAEMIAASKKGLKMPQKSTYFYPKLLSGLVFHSLND